MNRFQNILTLKSTICICFLSDQWQCNHDSRPHVLIVLNILCYIFVMKRVSQSLWAKSQFAIFLLYFHYVKICILMVYTRSNFHVSVITLFCGLTGNNSVVIFHCSMVSTLTSAGLVNDKLSANHFWIYSGFTYLENIKLSADWLSHGFVTFLLESRVWFYGIALIIELSFRALAAFPPLMILNWFKFTFQIDFIWRKQSSHYKDR